MRITMDMHSTAAFESNDYADVLVAFGSSAEFERLLHQTGNPKNVAIDVPGNMNSNSEQTMRLRIATSADAGSEDLIVDNIVVTAQYSGATALHPRVTANRLMRAPESISWFSVNGRKLSSQHRKNAQNKCRLAIKKQADHTYSKALLLH